MRPYCLSLAWLIAVLQAAKVYYVPETSTPPPLFMMQATAYNPVEGDIYLFSGINNEGTVLDSFSAFNVRTKRWRYIEPSNEERPGKSNTDPRYFTSGVFDEVKQILYVFGGESTRSLLNDLWGFDLETSRVRPMQWTEVKCTGQVPPQMELFGYVSYRDQVGDLRFVVGYGLGFKSAVVGLYE
jgi:hypothetical protein